MWFCSPKEVWLLEEIDFPDEVMAYERVYLLPAQASGLWRCSKSCRHGVKQIQDRRNFAPIFMTLSSGVSMDSRIASTSMSSSLLFVFRMSGVLLDRRSLMTIMSFSSFRQFALNPAYRAGAQEPFSTMNARHCMVPYGSFVQGLHVHQEVIRRAG